MALKGSLDDFNILNILQMVKLEGKTGRLTLTEGEAMLKITFDGGAIIYAETQPAQDEARIKGTLLSNGLLAEPDWLQIKKTHEDKLKPYWELLAKKIPSSLLIELIHRQTLDNVYDALRWTRGMYEFAIMKSIRYNNKVMQPMDVDAILMEGCRLADEWPRILKSIPPLTSFITKNIIGDEEDESINARAGGGGPDADWTNSLEREILNARGVELLDADIAALSVIEDGKTIDEIMDAARQPKFNTLEAVQRLLQMGVVKIEQRKKASIVATDSSSRSLWIGAVTVLALLVVAGFYWQALSLPQSIATQKTSFEKVSVIKAREGLKKLRRGLSIYYTLKGTVPDSLSILAESGFINPTDLIDPWNRPYKLGLNKNSFALYSNGSDAFLHSDDIVLTTSADITTHTTASKKKARSGKKQR